MVVVWCGGVVDATAHQQSISALLVFPDPGLAQRCVCRNATNGQTVYFRYIIAGILATMSRVSRAAAGWSWNCTLRSSRPDKTVTDDCFLRGHLLAAKADQTPIRLVVFVEAILIL